MPSTVTWLAHSDSERRKVLEIIERFKERDTRDELGLGSIRDAIAELLSPGTSTIQTRPRYFLFIPWIYRQVESQGPRSMRAGERARRAEIELIDILANSADSDGAIGRFAGNKLKRLPSAIYWSGLASWGIRLFHGSREQYHQWLDLGGPQNLLDGLEADDAESPVDRAPGAWHPGLPEPPEDFPNGTSLALRSIESDYLAERIRRRHPGTMLDFLAAQPKTWAPVSFPWEHPQVGALPEAVREQLRHGRCFSEAAHGAALLYNLMLAQEIENDGWETGYQDRLAEWATRIEQRLGELRSWDRPRFWEIAYSGGSRITPQTHHFVEQWLDLVTTGDASALSNNSQARSLILQRERQLKRGQARLGNRRALELWGGEAGTAQLSYRWGTTQQHAIDIIEGRASGQGNA